MNANTAFLQAATSAPDTATAMNELPEIPPEQSLIEYPCAFPIKVMGSNADGFSEAICALALQFDPAFDVATVETRPSKGGKYVGLTLTVTATSREQLDELYRTMSTHPMVKVVL